MSLNDKDNPLVSVLIPCYNVEEYVERAIRSILAQTYSNLEVWVIDDASTDNTLSLIRKFNDPRIRLKAFETNTQKVGAVNEVLKLVTGDFIAFQDADDWSEPDRIEIQLAEFFKDDKLGICFTNYKYVGDRNEYPDKIALTDAELKNEFLHFTYIREAGTSPTNCPTMMISKAALDKTGGYDPYFAGRVAEDVQWIYRILKYFKGITIDKVLYNYSARKGSLIQIQSTGIKPKFSYSWNILYRIIRKDIDEGIDILKPENSELLRQLELEACEEALSQNILLLHHTRKVYEESVNFRVGKIILAPIRMFSVIRKKLTRH